MLSWALAHPGSVAIVDDLSEEVLEIAGELGFALVFETDTLTSFTTGPTLTAI